MKKQFLISILTGALLVTGAAQAASWQESLSSAASELTKESGTSQGGLSASSLTGLLSNSSQSLSAGTMNLSTLGNSSLAKQVKTKACDLVLKQGVNFLS